MTMATISLRCVASIEVAIDDFALISMQRAIEVFDAGKQVTT